MRAELSARQTWQHRALLKRSYGCGVGVVGVRVTCTTYVFYKDKYVYLKCIQTEQLYRRFCEKVTLL